MADLDELQNEDAILIPFNELEKGEMQPINELIKENRKFDNRIVESMKADVSTSSLLKKFTYLPSSCLKAANALFDTINVAGKTEQKYQLCFYGNVGKKYVGRIHKPGEGMIISIT